MQQHSVECPSCGAHDAKYTSMQCYRCNECGEWFDDEEPRTAARRRVRKFRPDRDDD